MKKLLLLLIATAGAFNVLAQNINPESDFVGHHNDYVKERHHKKKKHREHKEREAEYVPQEAPVHHRERAARKEYVAPKEHVARIKKPVTPDMCSGWHLDVNAIGGLFTQEINSSGLASGYPNIANGKFSTPQFNNGFAMGLDAEVGYFFDHKRHFGIGTGLMYIYDHSDVTIDNFHVEYQAYDKFGNTFRQEITSNGQIKESWRTSNFNIPLLLKYKTKFSDKVGFTADAGVLFNISENTAYKTNSSFDYEAIYQYVTGESGTTTVYDNGAAPASGDLLITKSQYLATHSGGSIQSYFNSLRAQGYNVGLGVKPGNNKGNVSYMAGSVGILLRPAISIYLNPNLALNLGVWYLYQDFNRNASTGNKITDKVGSYSPVVNAVSGAANNSYGITAGLRFCLCKKHVMEPTAPETNDDDADEKAPPVSSENTELVAPTAPEPVPASPEETAVPDHRVDISTPLLFDINKTVIKPSSYPILKEAIEELNANPDAYLVIHGYTDNTGTVAYNKGLSKRRAQVVKNYLRRHGVKTRTLKTVGHGESNPAASNHTRAGRAKNRRAVMKLKEKSEE